MARTILGAALLAGLAVLGGAAWAGAETDAPKDHLAALNKLTGNEPLQGALKGLLDKPDQAKKLIAYAVPLTKDKKDDLGYNAAFVLGLAASELKDMKAAEALLRVCMQKAAKLQSVRKLLQSYGGLIEIYYDNKQYEDAARVCKELLDLKTDDGKPRLVYRAAAGRGGEVDFMEDDAFDSAKRIRPAVHQTLIKAIAKQGKYDQAIKLVDTLLKDQDHWLELHLKSWVLREAGHLDKAAPILEDVVTRVSRDRDLDAEDRDKYVEQYKYELSNLYVELKQIDRATEQLEYLLKKQPDNPGLYNDLGYIWADHEQKLDEAEKLIRKALDMDKERRQKRSSFDPKTDHDNGAYLDSLGWVLFKKKQLKEARDVLKKALEDKNAQHIEIYDHLGDVHMALGERAAAIAAWEKGLEVVGEGRRETERKAVVEKKLERAKNTKTTRSGDVK
jgi:tetratricopeptide (TPR) repeat protein